MARVIKAVDGRTAGAAIGVLKLTDFVAEARSVVLEARKEAARIVAEAAAKADQAAQAASERGYAEGYARGRNDGYADGQRQGSQQARQASTGAAAAALEAAQRVATELAAARGELLEQARRELLEFALIVAERIVGRVARADVAVAQANLLKALELAGVAKAVTVKVNPAQLQALREHCRQAVETLAMKGRVGLVADETVSPGGVKVQTGGGQIDATVETQLAQIAEALLGGDDTAEEPRASNRAPGRYQPVRSVAPPDKTLPAPTSEYER